MDRPLIKENAGGTVLLAIAFLGFISLGLPDAVGGVAWPSVREWFGLRQSGLGMVFVALGCGYFLSSFFGGRLTVAMGLGTLLTTSSLLVALAMFGSGAAPYWWVFVACAVVWGLGSGAIDAGLNAFVASHFSARNVSWLHACYSLGATLGPLVMTAAIVKAGSWKLGYGIVGAVMLTMSVLFLVTRGRWANHAEGAAAEIPPPASMRSVLRQPIVMLHVVIFFLYTGLEATVGQWSYTLLTEARGVGAERAGIWVAVYFGAIGVGRVLLGVVADRIGLDRLIRLSTVTALAGALLFAFAPVMLLAQSGLPVMGLGLAAIFPLLMTRTPQRLGHAMAAHAVGFQVSAAMLGAATMPGLAGLLVERLGLEVAARIAVVLASLLFVMHEALLVRSRRANDR